MRHRETTNGVESFPIAVTDALWSDKIPEQELHSDFCSSDIIVLSAVKRHLVKWGASVVTVMHCLHNQ